jgi:hypothetical protein
MAKMKECNNQDEIIMAGNNESEKLASINVVMAAAKAYGGSKRHHLALSWLKSRLENISEANRPGAA